jgi:hypothetical protein
VLEIAKREAVGSSMCFWWIHFKLGVNGCCMSCLLAATTVFIDVQNGGTSARDGQHPRRKEEKDFRKVLRLDPAV